MFSVKEIASIVNGTILGNPNSIIKGVCDLEKGEVGHIAYIKDSTYLKFLSETQASFLLVKKDYNIDTNQKTCIIVDNPGLAFISILDSIKYKTNIISKKNQKIEIEKNTKIGKNVKIFHNVNIGDNVIINRIEQCSI